MDLERLSVAMRSPPGTIRRMTFTGAAPEALEFVERRFPLWTCRRRVSEFAGRDLAQTRLRTWFIAVASRCGRCDGLLTPVRPEPAGHCTISSRTASLTNYMPRSVTACPRIRNRAAGRRGRACDEGARGSCTDGQAGSLSRPKSWTSGLWPRSRAPTPVATRRDAETAATHAWIPVLAAACRRLLMIGAGPGGYGSTVTDEPHQPSALVTD
jgi:hypothetical protein